MQVAETKTSSAANKVIQKKRQPFFNKDGQDSFFSKSASHENSFFSPPTIQPKLSIGQPNDKYEIEADAMADKVLQRLAYPELQEKGDVVVQAKPLAAAITPLVQKKCTACEREVEKTSIEEEDLNQESPIELQRKPIFESNADPSDDENNIQRKCEACDNEEEGKLQTKAEGSGGKRTTTSLENQLNSTKGGGSALPEVTRAQMEDSFGTDFSGVRVHTGGSAIQMNKELRAQAFTNGHDIYFNAGKYDPETSSGKHLLAHELTHTVQQNGNIISNISENIQKQEIIEVELVGPVNSYTISQTGDVINVGESAGPRILLNIILGIGGTVTLTWYNFASNLTEIGDLRAWLNFRNLRRFFFNQASFDSLSRQLTPAQWRSLSDDPLTRLLEMHEARRITIQDEVLLSSYKGMIYVEAKASLNRNEAAIDELLNASDRVEKIQEYSDGLKEASIVRDTLENRKSDIEHSLVQAHSFTFGIAGNYQNMNMARRLSLLREKGEVENALTFWYLAFPLLSRLRTNDIRSETVEMKLREIKRNIIDTRPRLDEAFAGRGSLDLMELIPIRQQLASRFGARATATIEAEDRRRGRNAIIGGVLLFAAGILLLFIPGGIFIDAAIGIAIAASSIRDAFIIGQSANTGLHIDDGLMAQGQARMAEFTAVLATVFAVMGTAAAGFRVLRVGALFSRVSSAAPELALRSRMNLARIMAKHPGLVTTFRRTTQELELELSRLNLRLNFEEIQGLRAAMFRYHRVPLISTSKESLDALLERVWARRNTINSEDDVYRLYSAATEANPLNLTNNQYLAEIQRIIGSRPVGTISNLQGNPTRGFHRFLRPGLTDAQLLQMARANRIAERIYLNSAADHSTEVMGFVVREIIDNPSQFPGVAMAKLTGPGAVSRRADAIVIYCETPAAAQAVLQRIRDYHRLNPTFFQRSAPPMTNQVMEGIGLASEPLGVAGQASFGSSRSVSIFTALRNIRQRGGSQEEFMQEVYNVLRQSGFDPNAPHLNISASTLSP